MDSGHQQPDSRQPRVQQGIPACRTDRDGLLLSVRRYVGQHGLVGPLSLGELSGHCERLIAMGATGGANLQYLAVLLNNEVWRDRFAEVPFDRRLLLLPKCLRNEARCPGEFDQLGLVCRACGDCRIHDLRQEALQLGYVVLIAEGAAAVMSLVQSGKIDAIVGVSCLASLERVFPCMEAAAVPAIAIPLLCDGCRDTQLDIELVQETMRLSSGGAAAPISMEAMRLAVESWFGRDALEMTLGAPSNETERLAQSWLARSGKRWRPLLAVCSFQAMQKDRLAALPDDLRNVALAVECFHKASLIHDDIEDNDAFRYGQKTLHTELGVPIALNVGDYLLGEGYRLIAQTQTTPQRKEQMLRAAADGHRCLCTGQGDELLWMRTPEPLSVRQVLDIFRRKTAPAFEVALRLGAIYGGAGPDVWQVLAAFSQAMGVAYQIRDDIEDFSGNGDSDIKNMRPSLLLAIAHERSSGPDRALLEEIWRRRATPEQMNGQLRQVVARLGVEQAAAAMLDDYRRQAVDCLRPLETANLKSLLRKVLGRIFSQV